MPIANKDLLYGSRIRRGYGIQAIRRDAAQIRCLVTGISNDVEGLRDAIRAVHDDIGAGLDISGDGSTGGRVVPIKSIEVTRLSPSTALAIATFNYVISNSPSAPGDTEFTDIRYEVTEMRVPVYRSITDENGSEVGYDADGLPAGRIMGCNSYTRTEGSTQSTYWSGRPISYQFSKTAVQIIVYGISNSPPSVDYVNANKKLNGASNTIGGITFSAGTLRLDGLKAERIVQYDGTDGTQSYRYVYAAYYTAAENFKHQVVHDVLDGVQRKIESDATPPTFHDHAFVTQNEEFHERYYVGSTPTALPVPSVS